MRGKRRALRMDEPLFSEEGIDEAGDEERARIVGGELGAVGGERGELAMELGGDVDDEVGFVAGDAEGADVGERDVAGEAAANAVEMMAREGDVKDAARGDDFEHRGGGEVVGVAVGAVGAEGDHDVGGELVGQAQPVALARRSR